MEPNRCDKEAAIMAHKYRKGYDSEKLCGWPLSCFSDPSESTYPGYIENGREGCTPPEAARDY